MLFHSVRDNDSQTAQADLNAAQRGDMQAFNRLIAAEQDQIYTLSYRAFGDEQLAVEATQAAVQQAARNIAKVQAGPFRLWLVRWVVWSCRDRIARQGRPQAGGAPGGAPQTVAAQAIERSLCRLPFELRLALILVDVAGLDYAETATVLGASREQVSRSVAEARARLIDS